MEAMVTPYSFSVSECDVADKERLEQFRQKRLEWLFLFEGDPDHNIREQINELMWSDALFRALNRMRSFGSESSPTASHNRAIAEFIDNGYIASQVLGISKLTDRWDDDPAKNVVSLRRLLKEVKHNSHLLTRENFVCFDGLPYDYEQVERKHYESLTAEQLRQFRYMPTKGPTAFGTSRLMHLQFDSVAMTEVRSRTDQINTRAFDRLEQILTDDTIARVRGFRNKYLGHAADAVSRKGHALERFGFSLNDFANAQRRLITAAEVIGSLLGTTVANPIRVAQYDIFEFLDQTLTGSGDIEELHEAWHQHEDSRDQWRASALSDLLNGVPPAQEDERDSEPPNGDR
jgi:hypothetical protein